jgi:hypothetical protein
MIGGRRVAQRLAGISEGLAMHFLVKRRELREIAQVFGGSLALEAIEHLLENAFEIAQRGVDIRQRQPPSRIVSDCRRIVQRIGTHQDGDRLRRGRTVAQAPVLLKPGEMTELPQRRIDDCQLRTEELTPRQVARELQRAFARIEQQAPQAPDIRCFPCVAGRHNIDFRFQSIRNATR